MKNLCVSRVSPELELLSSKKSLILTRYPMKTKLKQASSFRWFHLLVLLPIAAVGVAFYFALQSPESFFVPMTPSKEESARLEAFLKAAAKSPSGAWSASPQAISQYLATKVKPVSLANGLGVDVQMASCAVKLNEGFFDFQIKLKIVNRDCYLNLQIKPVTEDARLGIVCTSASIGRIAIPSVLIPLVKPLWAPCVASLETFITAVSTAEKAEISPKNVVIRWPASADKRP